MNVTTLHNQLHESVDEPQWIVEFESFADRFESYRDRLPAMPLAYTRTLLLKDERYEFVAMRWSPGSVSPIHDHGSSRCWALVLEGELFIENFARVDGAAGTEATIEPRERNVVTAGMLDHRLSWRELHRVRNLTDQPVFSLQLYAEPVSTYSIIDASSGRVRPARAIYDATISLE